MLKYQRGFISLQWAAILLVAGFLILCGVKMTPAYIENIYIGDAMKFLLDSNDDLHALDSGEIKSQLEKYMTVNSIGAVQAKSFKVHKTKKATYINSVYEVRVPIIYNVDVVMSFKNQLDTSNPESCCQYLVDNWNDD